MKTKSFTARQVRELSPDYQFVLDCSGILKEPAGNDLDVMRRYQEFHEHVAELGRTLAGLVLSQSQEEPGGLVELFEVCFSPGQAQDGGSFSHLETTFALCGYIVREVCDALAPPDESNMPEPSDWTVKAAFRRGFESVLAEGGVGYEE